MGQENMLSEAAEDSSSATPTEVVDISALAPDEPRQEANVLPIVVEMQAHEDPPRVRPRCAILGFTESRKDAPYDDRRYEIWGLNGLYVHKDCKRFDRWFDLHRADVIPKARMDAYQKLKMPVYLQEARADFPLSIRYPKAEVEEQYGAYMTNSVSWMLAKAGLMGFEVIEIYGVDMSQDTEYRFQRPNVEYMIGLLRGAGRDVRVSASSALLASTHQYGYGQDAGLRKWAKERMATFEGKIAECTAEMERLNLVRATFDGSRQAIDSVMQRLVADHTSMEPDAAQAGVPTAGG